MPKYLFREYKDIKSDLINNWLENVKRFERNKPERDYYPVVLVSKEDKTKIVELNIFARDNDIFPDIPKEAWDLLSLSGHTLEKDNIFFTLDYKGKSKGVWFDADEWEFRISSEDGERTTRQISKEFKTSLEEYREYTSWILDPKKKELEENVSFLNVDKEGRNVTKERWLELAEIASDGFDRHNFEQRAVWIDGIICCNASAAIEQLPYFENLRNTQKDNLRKQGNELYKACLAKRKFKGHYVTFASKEEILAEIEKEFN